PDKSHTPMAIAMKMATIFLVLKMYSYKPTANSCREDSDKLSISVLLLSSHSIRKSGLDN
ncbi:MAG: hypothetical protein P8J22_04305, partial [Pseudomonadales bacterium]|nr:hypothetical protein [Pseudomonadales bacterium]